MDDVDEEILEILSKEKPSLKILSKRLGLPSSTIHKRIKKLEEKGIIKNYRAEIDWKKAGYKVTAYILIYVDTTLLKKLGKTQKNIKKELENFYFTETANVVTGDADLIVKVRARDTEELGNLLTEYIHGIEGITKTKTLVCIY